MKVLVAGATGVIGRQLVPLLDSVGHEVVPLVRPVPRLEPPPSGAVVADALDGPALSAAVRQAAPDAVVSLLTAIPRRIDARHIARDMATTVSRRPSRFRASRSRRPFGQSKV